MKKGISLKKSVELLLGLAIVFICVYLFYKCIEIYVDWQSSLVDKNKATTIANVVDKGNMKGNYITVEYFVKGVRFNHREGSEPNVQLGEYFNLSYDSTNPSRCKINEDEVIFLPSQSISETEGLIKLEGEKNTVLYSYSVNGVQYERFRKYRYSLQFQRGQKVQIEYLLNNPLISRIK
jgi:hypothetical protein